MKQRVFILGEPGRQFAFGGGGAIQPLEYGGASRGVRGVRGVRRSRRGGQGVIAIKRTFGGGKRPFRKRTCRSKSRCGGLGLEIDAALGGSRGVRGVGRSRRVGGRYNAGVPRIITWL